MTRHLRQPSEDPYRKVRFREEAREIVAKDRHDRKAGFAVDTAGAIARALERAYKQGFTDAQDEHAPAPAPMPADGNALAWRLIPPRPRNAFWTCCRFMIGRQGDTPRGGHLEQDVSERGTAGWRLVVPGCSLEKVIGAKTIYPLVELGLLAPDQTGLQCLVLTDRGRATWGQFLGQGGEYPEDLTRL